MSLTVHFDVLYIFLLNRSHSITSIMHFHYIKKKSIYLFYFSFNFNMHILKIHIDHFPLALLQK